MNDKPTTRKPSTPIARRSGSSANSLPATAGRAARRSVIVALAIAVGSLLLGSARAQAGQPPPEPLLKTAFEAICLSGHTNQLRPLTVRGNGGRAIHGGIVREVTLGFKCPDCRKKFEQDAEVTIPNSAIRPKARILKADNLPPAPPPPPLQSAIRNPQSAIP